MAIKPMKVSKIIQGRDEDGQNKGSSNKDR